jgi:uncharacterized protein (DUF1697 family)
MVLYFSGFGCGNTNQVISALYQESWGYPCPKKFEGGGSLHTLSMRRPHLPPASSPPLRRVAVLKSINCWSRHVSDRGVVPPLRPGGVPTPSPTSSQCGGPLPPSLLAGGGTTPRRYNQIIQTYAYQIRTNNHDKRNKTMNTYIAFLRGINVGGNTVVSMKELAAICTHLGFEEVRTYINSGNVIFKSSRQEGELQAILETELLKKTGKNIGVVIRSVQDLEQLLQDNPFPEAVPSQVGVFLVTGSVEKKVLTEFVISGREVVVPGMREVYVHYPDGMGRSKLKWPPSLKRGTMRNINTLTRLATLAAEG